MEEFSQMIATALKLPVHYVKIRSNSLKVEQPFLSSAATEKKLQAE